MSTKKQKPSSKKAAKIENDELPEMETAETSVSSNGWTNGNKYTKFHNFKENPEFIGRFVEEVDFTNTKTNKTKKVFLFEKENGARVQLNDVHAIREAVEEHGQNVLYKFTFTGYKALEGGMKVAEFDFQYKSL